MKLTSLCFLHQARQSLLTTCEMKIKILHLIAFFTKTAIDALNNFYFKKDFSKFDPHVGETLCQIRAYKIVMLSSKVRDKVKLIAVQSEIKRLGSFYRLTKERLAFFQMELISGRFHWIRPSSFQRQDLPLSTFRRSVQPLLRR